jgi:hypothetical protein
MPLTSVEFGGGNVSDLSPLRGAPLKILMAYWNPISDLSPLKGMPLTDINIVGDPVTSLEPLRGMPLTYLLISGTKVSDLKPIVGMPLDRLECDGTPVTDLSPVAGMKLKRLFFTPANVTRGIDIARRMDSIEYIGTDGPRTFPTKEFWERYDRGEFGKPAAAAAKEK